MPKKQTLIQVDSMTYNNLNDVLISPNLWFDRSEEGKAITLTPADGYSLFFSGEKKPKPEERENKVKKFRYILSNGTVRLKFLVATNGEHSSIKQVVKSQPDEVKFNTIKSTKGEKEMTSNVEFNGYGWRYEGEFEKDGVIKYYCYFWNDGNIEATKFLGTSEEALSFAKNENNKKAKEIEKMM